MHRLTKVYAVILVFIFLAFQVSAIGPVFAQEGAADPEVAAILEQMSPEERVGQLFLVTFYGTDISPESDIAALITRYHVGGVVLLAGNNNFTDAEDLLTQVSQLTDGLQTLAGEQRQLPPEDVPGPPVEQGPYVPLFIGIEHEGTGNGHTNLLSGVTPLASNMAIGATWSPDLAEATGAVVGQELAALGINLLLGPPADVVEVPQPFTTGDLGNRVFGGEPFWVSQMTAAYVRGVHAGSEQQIAVVPRHFPGHGGADRLASVEVPTVRRSLDQLTQIDLQPFFAVTGNAPDELSVADGLMTGHIRYLGFQGDNPRLATRPISLDSQSLPVLLQLDPITGWHESGGLVISDALGLRGVRRFYDPAETSFPNRRIAQDAFLAGNDILYLGNFGSNPEVDQTATVIDTIEFFVQVYNEDPGFQAQVDEAVSRILSKKLDLYDQFVLDDVITDPADLEVIGRQSEITLNVAQNALTLLSPAQPDLRESPQAGDQIVIITDTRTVRQCDTCVDRSYIAVDALQSAILRLYGPQATGLLSLADINSFGFDRLTDFLDFGPLESQADEQTPEPDQLAVALDSADWIVFVMLDVNDQIPSSNAVKRFLAEASVSPDTQIVVMAMDAPYYLDSTEVSKLTAYYALYGHTGPFIDVAARTLFQQASLNGAPPVSVGGIGYDILEATSPDPNQVIGLTYAIEPAAEVEEGEVAPTEQVAESTSTPEDEPETAVGIGDTLRLVTGVILDHNGNPVPDGTPVEFVFNYVGEGLATTPVTTLEGVARTSFVVDRSGDLEITVQSNPAYSSAIIRLSAGSITTEQPEFAPTLTPTPTEIPATRTTIAPSPVAPTPTPGNGEQAPKNVGFGDLFLTLLGLTVIAGVIFAVSFVRGRDVNYSLLLMLSTVVFGLLGYNYYALALPGIRGFREWLGEDWAASILTWFAALLGVGVTLLGIYSWNKWMFPALRDHNRRK